MEKNSLHHIRGKRYPYLSAFDEDTGLYFRTGILKDGKDTGIDPFRADFPELLDGSVVGRVADFLPAGGRRSDLKLI